MKSRMIGFAMAGALVAGTASGARSDTFGNTTPAATTAVVASVELELKPAKLDPAVAGDTAQLLVTARTAKGDVIVAPASYVDSHGKPLTIRIANSSPANTFISPSSFTKATLTHGASNVATVTFEGRAHFHFPTFSVANAGLPALPKGGLTLTYVPYLGDDSIFDTYGTACFGPSEFQPFASVGGTEYGPYFALNHSAGCPKGDILRTHPFQTIVVNSAKDGALVTLGFGSDKIVYFAFNHPGANAPTEFGYLRNLAVRKSADVTSISRLTLGNDGSLWFTGVWHGKATIGKLPPPNSSGLHPIVYTVPKADAAFGIEPGVKDTEAFIYHAPGGMYLGTIGTGLTGFKSVHISTSNSTSPGFGDLLAGPAGIFDVSASDSLGGSIYQIATTGKVTRPCTNVGTVYRLADGTGLGLRSSIPGYFGDSAVVHIVPGVACTQVPNPPDPSPYPYKEFSLLLGVDTTTEDWLFYADPNGHRFGVF